MTITREQVLANRSALAEALAAGAVQTWEGSRHLATAWLQFRGFSHNGGEAIFDLSHHINGTYLGSVAGGQPSDLLECRVGDDEFDTYKWPWAVSGAMDGEDKTAVRVGRDRILTMFSPDGTSTDSEATAALAEAFQVVRAAAAACLVSKAA